MNFNFEELKKQGLELADIAKKTALDLADKGKAQVQLVEQQAKLVKAQRQLGALVYSLHKSGEENQPLVEKYMEAIEQIEAAIEEIKAGMTPEEVSEAESAMPAEEMPIEEPTAPAAEAPAEPAAEAPAKKVCPQCGADNAADALFCTGCGSQL